MIVLQRSLNPTKSTLFSMSDVEGAVDRILMDVFPDEDLDAYEKKEIGELARRIKSGDSIDKKYKYIALLINEWYKHHD